MSKMMDKPAVTEPIPLEIAMKLCEEVRAENQHQWLSAGHWQCWGCVFFTTGVPEKMCFSSTEGNLGCALINRRLDHLGK